MLFKVRHVGNVHRVSFYHSFVTLSKFEFYITIHLFLIFFQVEQWDEQRENGNFAAKI